MKKVLYTLMSLLVLSCTPSLRPAETSSNAEIVIDVEKEPWVLSTKASDDRAFAKDIPWKEGDKVLLLSSNQSFKNILPYNDETGIIFPTKKIICTVVKANGLKCTLVPETPIEEGSYRAIYPVYRYACYDFLHLSFLYEDWKELDFIHQNIVVSDPVVYKKDDKLSVVMKHICALVDIDICPPMTGNISYLKLFAQNPIFAGKADIWLDKEYNVDDFASGWLNFTTLRGDGEHMEEGVIYPTSTGLLPIQYNGIPVTIHIVYEDGTHFVSEPLPMPSLSFGEVNKLVVSDFKKIQEPMSGFWGDYYGDPSPSPYPIN